jgi:hypothetical protein
MQCTSKPLARIGNAMAAMARWASVTAVGDDHCCVLGDQLGSRSLGGWNR